MITLAILTFWLGLAVIVTGMFLYHIFKRAVRAWMSRGRANAGLSAGRRVGRTARPNLATALLATRAMRRVH